MRKRFCLVFAVALAGCYSRQESRAMDGADDDPIVIRNLARRGSFEVENRGPDLEVQWALGVEKQKSGSWVAVASQLSLQENCTTARNGKCRLIKKGEKIRPMPYEGYTCDMKCPPGCMANVRLAPGTFRIIVSTCDGSRRFFGPAFHLE